MGRIVAHSSPKSSASFSSLLLSSLAYSRAARDYVVGFLALLGFYWPPWPACRLYRVAQPTPVWHRANHLVPRGRGIPQVNGTPTAFHDAIQAFSRQPLGRGRGSFYTVSIDQLTYPHNLLLEVAVEAGLLPALALLAWILHVLSTVLDRQAADSSLLALPFIFLLANAMWSGDINGNRGLLTIGMIALSMRTHPRSSVARLGAPREHSRRLISKKSAPPFARPLRTIVRREIEAG